MKKTFDAMIGHFGAHCTTIEPVGIGGRSALFFDPEIYDGGPPPDFGVIFVDATNRAGENGAHTDRCFEAACRYRFKLAVAVGQPKLFGLATGFSANPYDLDYFGDLVFELKRRGCKKVYITAFGDATWPVLKYHAAHTGDVAGVGVVCGTVDSRFHKLPAADGSVIHFHAWEDGDPALPYRQANGRMGGVGKPFKMKLRCFLLAGFAPWFSRPDLVVEGYARANGVLEQMSETTDSHGIYHRYQFGPDGEPAVVRYLVKGAQVNGKWVGNGHTWNGRYDEPSPLSNANGDPLPVELLNLWDRFADDWGWEKEHR